jgi:hypothetical protein
MPIENESVGSVPFTFYSNSVASDLSTKWNAKNHLMTEVMAAMPSRKLIYVNIPKVASTSIKNALSKTKRWEVFSRTELEQDALPMHKEERGYNLTYLVVWREPKERWISGIVEYLLMYHRNIVVPLADDPMDLGIGKLYANDLAVSMIFDRLVFDDHTDLQCSFIEDIPFSNCQFFHMEDEQLVDKLNTVMREFELPELTLHRLNSTEYDSDAPRMIQTVKLQNTIRRLIDTNEEYDFKLRQYLKPDYELIKKVSFK